jgi:hypothetical protein
MVFTNVPKSGPAGMPQNYYGMGVAVGDYDNDGWGHLRPNTVATRSITTRDGTFTDVTKNESRRAGGAQARIFRLRPMASWTSSHSLRRLDFQASRTAQAPSAPGVLPPDNYDV